MKFIDYLFRKIEFNPNQGYAMFYYRNGETFNKCFGKVKDSDSDDITFDSNFRLASVSKQFIAFGIVKLVHEGKLTYQTNIRYIFSDLPTYFEHITIKQVLNHTSGILNYESMQHNEDDPQLQDDDIITFSYERNKSYLSFSSVNNELFILDDDDNEIVLSQDQIDFILDSYFRIQDIYKNEPRK